MKNPGCYIALLLALSCQPALKEADLPLLNGYWEIREVNAPDGAEKEYRVNETVDYIELRGRTGFRKKVQPKPDGSFLASDDASFFDIREKDGRFFMSYHTEYDQWEEELLSLDKNGFSVVNADNIAYHYIRFNPVAPAP